MRHSGKGGNQKNLSREKKSIKKPIRHKKDFEIRLREPHLRKINKFMNKVERKIQSIKEIGNAPLNQVREYINNLNYKYGLNL